ncbi:MAG: DUF6522 family protein [Steroidobacteraceae bacterium]
MSEINIANGSASIDAALIASDLALNPAGVLEAMRSGRLTSRWERGVDDDAGCHRVTFFHGNRQLCLIVDANGHVLERSLRQPRGVLRRPMIGDRRP